MQPDKKRKQIAFDIHPNLHKEVKLRAITEDISMNLWIQRAITRALNLEKRDKDGK